MSLKHSRVCVKHFTEDSFEQNSNEFLGTLFQSCTQERRRTDNF